MVEVVDDTKEASRPFYPFNCSKRCSKVGFSVFHINVINKYCHISEIYENEALLLSDEATVIAGLLVGLNVIDCNLCLKMNEDYDQPVCK